MTFYLQKLKNRSDCRLYSTDMLARSRTTRLCTQIPIGLIILTVSSIAVLPNAGVAIFVELRISIITSRDFCTIHFGLCILFAMHEPVRHVRRTADSSNKYSNITWNITRNVSYVDSIRPSELGILNFPIAILDFAKVGFSGDLFEGDIVWDANVAQYYSNDQNSVVPTEARGLLINSGTTER